MTLYAKDIIKVPLGGFMRKRTSLFVMLFLLQSFVFFFACPFFDPYTDDHEAFLLRRRRISRIKNRQRPPVPPRYDKIPHNSSRRERLFASAAIISSLLLWLRISYRITNVIRNKPSPRRYSGTEWTQDFLQEDDGTMPLEAPPVLPRSN